MPKPKTRTLKPAGRVIAETRRKIASEGRTEYATQQGFASASSEKGKLKLSVAQVKLLERSELSAEQTLRRAAELLGVKDWHDLLDKTSPDNAGVIEKRAKFDAFYDTFFVEWESTFAPDVSMTIDVLALDMYDGHMRLEKSVIKAASKKIDIRILMLDDAESFTWDSNHLTLEQRGTLKWAAYATLAFGHTLEAIREAQKARPDLCLTCTIKRYRSVPIVHGIRVQKADQIRVAHARCKQDESGKYAEGDGYETHCRECSDAGQIQFEAEFDQMWESIAGAKAEHRTPCD